MDNAALHLDFGTTKHLGHGIERRADVGLGTTDATDLAECLLCSSMGSAQEPCLLARQSRTSCQSYEHAAEVRTSVKPWKLVPPVTRIKPPPPEWILDYGPDRPVALCFASTRYERGNFPPRLLQIAIAGTMLVDS